METEITLDTIVLNQMGSYSKDEFKHALVVLHDKSLDKFGMMNPDSFSKADKIKKNALKFSAIYLAAAAELSRKLVLNSTEMELNNMISCYTASQAVMQLNKDNNGMLENKLVARKSPDFSKINFDKSDTSVIDDILDSYKSFITAGSASSSTKAEINYFFQEMSNQLIKLIQQDKYNKHRELVEGLKINGPQFRVDGIKARKPIEKDTFIDSDDQFKKDFDYIKLGNDKKVRKSEIIGNEVAVEKIGNAVKNLMAYRIDDKVNPFLNGRRKKGFKQGLLLLGNSGTGKTLTAFYGMTLADNIAKNYGRDLSIVKFNINSSYQEGGVQMLKHQLTEICQGEKIYYLFIDEIDTQFSSRTGNSSKSQYHKQKLGEFMRFLDGEYPNLGNYIVIATANDTKGVDKAVKSRLERVHCPGPVSAEEKAKVLALHFGDDISNGLVQVRKWRDLGEIAAQSNLSGRDIQQVVNNCYTKASTISDQAYAEIYSARTLPESQDLIRENFHSITDEMVLREISLYGKKDIEEQKALMEFYD